MMHITEAALVDYLYEEGDPAERLKIAQHLQDCATCSVAVLEMQAVRGMLSDWTPPATQLGFRIVQERTRHPWWKPAAGIPVWAQAAAAVLLFAAGMSVSQLDVDYAGGALTVRARSGTAGSAAHAPATALEAMSVSPTRHATDFHLVAAEQARPSETPAREASSPPTEEVLRQVRAMIQQSEARQQRELALRLMQLGREFDTQRVADMRRVEQTFGQLETQTDAEIAQQRQLMEYLVKTSGR